MSVTKGVDCSWFQFPNWIDTYYKIWSIVALLNCALFEKSMKLLTWLVHTIRINFRCGGKLKLTSGDQKRSNSRWLPSLPSIKVRLNENAQYKRGVARPVWRSSLVPSHSPKKPKGGESGFIGQIFGLC